MPKRGFRSEKPLAGDPVDPRGMHAALAAFFRALALKDYSPHSINGHRQKINDFIRWCAERDVARPDQVTRSLIQSYQRWLMGQRDKRKKLMSFRNQYSRIGSLRVWFRWLFKNDWVAANPTNDLDLPRLGRRLPRGVLTETEAEAILAVPDVNTPAGIRDRAILETFYSTGMRRMELVKLKLEDVDAERGVVTIWEGKGKKDRVVPIGKRALEWIELYLAHARPKLLKRLDVANLFVTLYGNDFTAVGMSRVVKRAIEAAGVQKPGSCHLFRHTMATLMLEGGADVRFIQELLGHKHLNTTQIYTRVSIRKLQEVHAKTHPACAERPAPEGEAETS